MSEVIELSESGIVTVADDKGLYRDRVFMLLLYKDDETHVEALEHIKRSFDYACILHDKDLEKDGKTPKKEHYHVVVRVGKNAIWNSAFSKKLGIDKRYVGTKVRNFDSALQYLIHNNDIDKHQYELDEVFGTLVDRLKESLNKDGKSEGEKVCELLDYIDDYKGILTIKVFARYCALNGYWDVYRRASGSVFNKIIDEHNEQVVKMRLVYNDMSLNEPPKKMDIDTFVSDDNIGYEQCKIEDLK